MELFAKVAHERGAAVLVVTHDQRSLDAFDRTFQMEDDCLKANLQAIVINPGVSLSSRSFVACSSFSVACG
jgi:ABC-type lipoprotein export system ATPase subunit